MGPTITSATLMLKLRRLILLQGARCRPPVSSSDLHDAGSASPPTTRSFASRGRSRGRARMRGRARAQRRLRTAARPASLSPRRELPTELQAGRTRDNARVPLRVDILIFISMNATTIFSRAGRLRHAVGCPRVARHWPSRAIVDKWMELRVGRLAREREQGNRALVPPLAVPLSRRRQGFGGMRPVAQKCLYSTPTMSRATWLLIE